MNCKVCKTGKPQKGRIYCSKQCYYNASKIFGLNRRKSWKLSDTSKKNQSEGMMKYRKNHPSWIKGLTAKTDNRVMKMAKNVSKALTGKKRLNMTGDNNPSRRPEVREGKRKKMNKKWEDREWAKNTLKKTMNSSYRGSPNKQEILIGSIIDSILPNTYKFVGDGSVWIGRKNPDFVHNSKKMIIEFFGRKWHKLEHEPEKIEYFKELGYECLVIWTEELNDIEKLKVKIIKFNR